MPSQPENETVNASGYQAEIIRTSRRKTASIKVIEGHVSVIVPESLPVEKIESLLHKKARWIKEKLDLQNQVTPVKAKEYVSGESFSYLGRNYRLKVIEGPYPSIQFQQGKFIVTVRNKLEENASSIRQMLIQWYKTHAEIKFKEKTKRYAKIIGVKPISVGIKPFKSRWGSCSKTGEIYYNWKVIMAPHRIVDYVVVHELCHILHHDHSPQFWKTVERYVPDYLECKDWLKENAGGLSI